MMEPANRKTVRNHVLPGPIREKRCCEENAGFDEILLSPDRLGTGGLVDNNDVDMSHLTIYQQADQTEEDNNQGKIQRVLPVRDDENILKSNNDSDLGTEDEQKQEGKLSAVKLQKVLSEDLSWLDTIIYTTTNTPTVKRGDHSVRSVNQ